MLHSITCSPHTSQLLRYSTPFTATLVSSQTLKQHAFAQTHFISIRCITLVHSSFINHAFCLYVFLAMALPRPQHTFIPSKPVHEQV